jgi:hypothetical protein
VSKSGNTSVRTNDDPSRFQPGIERSEFVSMGRPA